MVHEHFMGLRRHPQYAHCHIRVFIEANLSAINADYVANFLRHPRYGPLDVACETTAGARRYGVWTTHDKKEAYAEELKRAIPTLSFARILIGEEQALAETCHELFVQLAKFRREVVESATPEHQLHAKIVLTGKSAGSKDDLVLALCIALYHMYRSILRDDEFRKQCERSHIQMAF